MESILIKSIKSEDRSSEEEYMREHYNGEVDMSQFNVECDTLKVLFKETKPNCFDQILSCLTELPEAQRALIPNTVAICKLLLVNPATTATAERSFSTARRVKTWMRSNMLAARFNSLSILHTHKSITDDLNLNDIANEFISKCDSRKLTFGHF